MIRMLKPFKPSKTDPRGYKQRRPYRVKVHEASGLWFWAIIAPNGTVLADSGLGPKRMAVRSARNFVRNAGPFFVYAGVSYE